MRLSNQEIELFYKLYHQLLVYVNKKFGIIKGIDSPKDIKKFSLEDISKIRERLYKQAESIIDSFIAENPSHFSVAELKIINSWKHFIKGRFLIFRYLKNYTIFLSLDEKEPKAYGVLALVSTFEEMLGPYLPIACDAILLPFNNKIIYDSIISPYPITFGGGMRRDFNDSYQQAKLRFGIITSLPFSKQKLEQTNADKLRFYLKSARNREKYSEEICELIEEDESLLTLYHQEMGKISSRTYGKQLHEMGLRSGWFAILEGIIIGSGTTRDELERIIQNLVPAEKQNFVYIFRLKGD